jgi:hypothetical protein
MLPFPDPVTKSICEAYPSPCYPRICQSMAIMEYINDVRPEACLLPKDPKSRAKVRSNKQKLEPIPVVNCLHMYILYMYCINKYSKCDYSNYVVSLHILRKYPISELWE